MTTTARLGRTVDIPCPRTGPRGKCEPHGMVASQARNIENSRNTAATVRMDHADTIVDTGEQCPVLTYYTHKDTRHHLISLLEFIFNTSNFA